jgi:hypothetical protein
MQGTAKLLAGSSAAADRRQLDDHHLRIGGLVRGPGMQVDDLGA